MLDAVRAEEPAEPGHISAGLCCSAELLAEQKPKAKTPIRVCHEEGRCCGVSWMIGEARGVSTLTGACSQV